MVKNTSTRNSGSRFLMAGAFYLSMTITAMPQAVAYQYFYRIYFTDKGSYTTGTFTPRQLLSERALNRREKAGVEVLQYSDLPVFHEYLNKIKAKGLTLHCTSKWLNTGLFKSALPADLSMITAMPFVEEIQTVRKPGSKNSQPGKLDLDISGADVPPFDNPLVMVNGYAVHNSGFTGKGILIAVLDGGFLNANKIPSLAHLFSRAGVTDTRDFVNGGSNVYSFHNHGTAVMSVLAGMLSGNIAGTAPGADYILLRTEDTSSEFAVEEDFWAAGAEYADSAGADIISSSLGYSTFDDPSMNYDYADLDGDIPFVTKAADMAASKGILVFASAGNERNKTWRRIIAPSDGDSVIAVGAVDGYNVISSFSSAGPSADRRIKPDNVTQGVSVPVQVTEGSVQRSNGTSFSCPVLSGICASVMQAVPEATPSDLIESLRKFSDRYLYPDSLYGYGLPDMAKVLSSVQEKYLPEIDTPVRFFPNPFTSSFEVVFSMPPVFLYIDILSISGKLLYRKSYSEFTGRSLTISQLADHGEGVYLCRIRTATGTYTGKLIKMKSRND